MASPDEDHAAGDETDIAHHPHDGFVKRIFTDPKTAAVELRQVLPAALCDRLDWDTLRVEPASFIDPKLRPRHSDILYTVATADGSRRVSLYTVLEHQSTPDPTMAARFLIYVGRLYERIIRQQDGVTAIPMVIPILLYQGPTGWTLPRSLSESLDVPAELLEVFPSPIELTFAVDDLEHSVLGETITRDQLLRDKHLTLVETARTMLWLARHPEASTGARAVALGLLIKFIAGTEGTDGVLPFITYLLSAFPSQTPIHAIIEESLHPDAQHMYTTMRDALIAQGRVEGRADGIAEGRADGRADGIAQMLLRLLATRGLNVGDALRRRIAGCRDEARLRQWFDRAVTASDVAEVFES